MKVGSSLYTRVYIRGTVSSIKIRLLFKKNAAYRFAASGCNQTIRVGGNIPETDKGLIYMTTRQPLRHLTLKHIALIKERLGHVAASHPKLFFSLPGFFAQFIGSKRGRVVAMATKHAFYYSLPILALFIRYKSGWGDEKSIDQ
jgi:hypothetical protein